MIRQRRKKRRAERLIPFHKTKEASKVLRFDRYAITAITAVVLFVTVVALFTASMFWNLSSRSILMRDRKLEQRLDRVRQSVQQLQNQFPVHVGDDMEEIVHPGVLFSEVARENVPSKIRVPRFWNPPQYGMLIRDFLGNFGERLLTPEIASMVGSSHEGLPTIFVSIASYRDPECAPTVESIYQRAKHPERIRVAVVDQVLAGDKKCDTPLEPCENDPDQALCKYRHLMEFYTADAGLSVGPVFARHLGNRMYRGEYFAMQADSHVRFVQDWEASLIKEYEAAANEYAVLTVYLSDIVGSIDPVTHENLDDGERPMMCDIIYEGEEEERHLRLFQQPKYEAALNGQPQLHPFWAAGFSFARGHFVVQVPYDQYLPLVFQGEEISMGVRGFTYGYDYYTPENQVCFHIYKQFNATRKKVPLFTEHEDNFEGAYETAMRRLNGIIGTGQAESEDEQSYYKVEEKEYGLGQIRKAEKFFRTFGIHTDTQQVEKNLCFWVRNAMTVDFKPHLRSDRMGINYNEITFEFKNPRKGRRRRRRYRGYYY